MDPQFLFTAAVAVGTFLTGAWALAQLILSASAFRRWERWVKIRDSFPSDDSKAIEYAEKRATEALINYAIAARVRAGRAIASAVFLTGVLFVVGITLRAYGPSFFTSARSEYGDVWWPEFLIAVLLLAFVVFNVIYADLRRDKVRAEMGRHGSS